MSDISTVATPAAIPAQRLPDGDQELRVTPAVFPLARHVQAQVDQGTHPATHAPIRQDTSCGTCVHAVTKTLDDGACRTRCALAVSRRGGPDILPAFPGCDHHTPRHPVYRALACSLSAAGYSDDATCAAPAVRVPGKDPSA